MRRTFWLGVTALCLVIASGVLISQLRPRVSASLALGAEAEREHYVLPTSERLVLLSLGYRAALADLLWGHTLVWHGQHLEAGLRFEHGGDYIDAVLHLDPTFRDPYDMADVLLTYQSVPSTYADYKKSREVLERGVRERPDDTLLWLRLGQFVGLVSPGRFADDVGEETAAAWEADGARYIARACELGAGDPEMEPHCLNAAFLYKKAGQELALESFLERVIATAENEFVRERAIAELALIHGEKRRVRGAEVALKFRQVHAEDLPFTARDLYNVISPPFAPWKCAGPGPSPGEDCGGSWASYLNQLRPD